MGGRCDKPSYAVTRPCLVSLCGVLHVQPAVRPGPAYRCTHVVQLYDVAVLRQPQARACTCSLFRTRPAVRRVRRMNFVAPAHSSYPFSASGITVTWRRGRDTSDGVTAASAPRMIKSKRTCSRPAVDEWCNGSGWVERPLLAAVAAKPTSFCELRRQFAQPAPPQHREESRAAQLVEKSSRAAAAASITPARAAAEWRRSLHRAGVWNSESTLGGHSRARVAYCLPACS